MTIRLIGQPPTPALISLQQVHKRFEGGLEALREFSLEVGAGEFVAAAIPAYPLPAPSLIATTLMAHFGSLAASWWFPLKITFGALALGGIGNS